MIIWVIRLFRGEIEINEPLPENCCRIGSYLGGLDAGYTLVAIQQQGDKPY